MSAIRAALRPIKAFVKRAAGHQEGAPVFPKKGNQQGLKVHLGAGPVNLQGWVNIDGRQADHIHLSTVGFSLNEFAAGSLAEIYMCHVLEHFSFTESKDLLIHLRTKLKPGGVIRLSVPDFQKLAELYAHQHCGLKTIQYALMGGQDYLYNFHKSVFDAHCLRDLLLECGYAQVEPWETLQDFGVDLGDWSSKGFKVNGKLFPISLNLKAVNPE